MTKQGSIRNATMLGAFALVLAACGGKTTPVQPRLTNTLTITGTEYRFDLDKTSISEGTAQVTFKNTGTEFHMVGWGRLKAGTTFQKFQETIQKNQDAAFGLIEEEDNGAPGLLSPGQQSTITTNLLKAGSYALICFIPAPDKTPHVAKGMLGNVEVTAAGTPAPSPFAVKADGEVTMTDYSFGALPDALKKGKGTIRFGNAGKEAHEAVIARLEPGKTFADADKYFTEFFEGPKPPTGPPPASLVAGFFAIPAGGEIWLAVDLPPGNYAIVCGEQTEDGKDHDDLGMKTEFTVA